MDVIKYIKPRVLGDLVAFELDQNFCREQGTLLGGSGSARSVLLTTALGRISLGSGTATAAAPVSGSGGTVGNGVMGAITVSAAVVPGVYRLTITNAVTNAGAFELVRLADQKVIGVGAVAAAFNTGGFGFTLADGSADYVEDDYIDITVVAAAGGAQLVPINFAATDGSQNFAGFPTHDTTAPDGVDTPMSYLARGPMIVRAEEITWPDGATDNQKAAAIAQAAALGILVRASG